MVSILAGFPSLAPPPRDYVLRLVDAVERYPSHLQAKLADPVKGISATCRFLPTVAEIIDCIEGPASHKWADGTMHREPERMSHGPNFTGSADQAPDPRQLLSLEDRKAFVIRELGYDPSKSRSSRACFLAPAPLVDVSDFPASTSRAFDPSPDAKPAPENPPWRDKAELAKSMERINRHMASKDYLFGEGDPPPKEPAP